MSEVDGMKLAGLVLDWAGYDEVVSEKGWDGGETETNWDEAKKKMVALAREIVEGAGGDRHSAEMSIVRENTRGPDGFGVLGMAFSVHPAHGTARGYVAARMVVSEGTDTLPESIEPFKLYFDDLVKILAVLHGIDEKAEDIKIKKANEEDVGDYGVDLSLVHVGGEYQFEHTVNFVGKVKYEKLMFRIAPQEALGLSAAIEHAMLLVCFGAPGSMSLAKAEKGE